MISYAQNFEDVMLARLFEGQQVGFYVDVGASHPTELSVTRHFYDLGWRGINVEPLSSKWELLKRQRPRDVNLQVGVGNAPGMMTLYCVVDNDALSTFNTEQAKALAAAGHAIVRLPCEVDTLERILDASSPPEIDFLKIDTEGLEGEVLESLNLQR